MHRIVQREFRLNADEVKTAILCYLKDLHDYPVPKKFSDAEVSLSDAGAVIKWGEADTI